MKETIPNTREIAEVTGSWVWTREEAGKLLGIRTKRTWLSEPTSYYKNLNLNKRLTGA